MVVRAIMTPNPIAAAPETPLPVVYQLMKRYEVRHLPILEHGELVGILTERDLREARPFLEEPVRLWEVAYQVANRPARDLMRAPVYSIEATGSVEQAADMMQRHRIGALPIMEHGTLVGIVTVTDILKLVAQSVPNQSR